MERNTEERERIKDFDPLRGVGIGVIDQKPDFHDRVGTDLGRDVLEIDLGIDE